MYSLTQVSVIVLHYSVERNLVVDLEIMELDPLCKFDGVLEKLMV